MSIEKKPPREYTAEDKADDEAKLAKLVDETRIRTAYEARRVGQEMLAINNAIHNEHYQKIIGEVKGGPLDEGLCVELTISPHDPTREELVESVKQLNTFLNGHTQVEEFDGTMKTLLNCNPRSIREMLEGKFEGGTPVMVNSVSDFWNPTPSRMAGLSKALCGMGHNTHSSLSLIQKKILFAKERMAKELGREQTPEEVKAMIIRLGLWEEPLTDAEFIPPFNREYHSTWTPDPKPQAKPEEGNSLTYVQRQRLYYTPRG